MALALDHEFAYIDLPVVPLRLGYGIMEVETEAVLDTGADVTVFDATLAELLDVHFAAANIIRVVSITGTTSRVRYAHIDVTVLGLPEDFAIPNLAIGFLPGLAKTAGNLLGRNFLEHFDFGLHHDVLPSRRRLYLGKA